MRVKTCDDDVLTHLALAVRGHRDQRFEQKWIDRDLPIGWPARSPDLTMQVYFLWGQMKSLIYKTPVESEEDLLARFMALRMLL